MYYCSDQASERTSSRKRTAEGEEGTGGRGRRETEGGRERDRESV